MNITKPLLIFATTLGVCAGCDSDIDNLPPSEFSVQTVSTTKTTANVAWGPSTDPENGAVFFSIFLNGTLMADNYVDHSYTFENLTGNTEYTGEIVSSDDAGNTSSTTFSFLTKLNDVYEGSLQFRNQAEIDDFSEHCFDVVNGNVVIGINVHSDIDNLEPLSCIREIKGSLTLQFTGDLMSLKGLENLISIGTDLYLKDLPRVDSFDELSNLKSIGGNFTIEGTGPLEISGLDALQQINGALSFRQCTAHTISGFNQLTNVGHIGFFNNIDLKVIKDFSSVTSISGSLYVSQNFALTSLEAFENLQSMGNILVLDGMNVIEEIHSFKNLVTAERIAISELHSFVNLNTFPKLEKATLLILTVNNSLASLSFPKLAELGELDLRMNPSLSNVNGLESLRTVHSILIFRNAGLQNLDALKDAQSTGPGRIIILQNSSLEDFCGLQKIVATPVFTYDVSENKYNPELWEIRDGICKQ